MLHATQRLNNLEQTHEQPIGGSTLRARQNVTYGLTMDMLGNLEDRNWLRYSHPDRLRRLVRCAGEHAPAHGQLQNDGQRGFFPLRDIMTTETKALWAQQRSRAASSRSYAIPAARRAAGGGDVRLFYCACAHECKVDSEPFTVRARTFSSTRSRC